MIGPTEAALWAGLFAGSGALLLAAPRSRLSMTRGRRPSTPATAPVLVTSVAAVLAAALGVWLDGVRLALAMILLAASWPRQHSGRADGPSGNASGCGARS